MQPSYGSGARKWNNEIANQIEIYLVPGQRKHLYSPGWSGVGENDGEHFDVYTWIHNMTHSSEHRNTERKTSNYVVNINVLATC